MFLRNAFMMAVVLQERRNYDAISHKYVKRDKKTTKATRTNLNVGWTNLTKTRPWSSWTNPDSSQNSMRYTLLSQFYWTAMHADKNIRHMYI